MEEKMVTAAWLKDTDLFSGLGEPHLRVILSHSTVESFPEGRTIFHQEEEAHHLYILIEGAVALTVKTGEKIDFMTSTIDKERAVFGMPCLLESSRYNVTAACLKPSKVLVIEAAPHKESMGEDLKMGVEIMKKLASIYFNRLNEVRDGVSKLLNVLKFKTP
jgi:CRP-like cAMP-binding protein